MLNPRAALSCSAAGPVEVLRQVRNGTSSSPSASNARYPCIIALTPAARKVVGVTPYRASTSATRAAYAARSPASTARRGVGPATVDELVLPLVGARGDRYEVLVDQARLDARGAEFDPQGRAAVLDLLSAVVAHAFLQNLVVLRERSHPVT
ncbi:hypothetical protein GCM10017714_00110 [Curtobacterium pusillum]